MPAYAGKVTIAWDNPTHNVDGSKLTNFAGNAICYGTWIDRTTHYVDVGNTNKVTLKHIKVNTKYYFYVFSYNSYNQFGPPSRKMKFIIKP
jgi:hypothetical protein